MHDAAQASHGKITELEQLLMHGRLSPLYGVSWPGGGSGCRRPQPDYGGFQTG